MTEGKDTIVLLPGTLCNEKLWKNQIKELTKDYHVVVGDLTSNRSINDMARTVLQNISGKFHLAGLSLGGIVAIEIMKAAPERVEKLILLDTNPMPPTLKQKKIWRKFKEITQENKFNDVTEKYLMPTLLSHGNNDKRLQEIIIEMSNEVGPEGLLNQLNALESREDNIGVLKTIQNKTLVIVGENDQVCPISMSQIIHKEIRDSKLTIIKNAGHLSTLEEPEETTRVIKNFLN